MFLDKQHQGGERGRAGADDALLQHVVALALQLVLDKLWISILPHCHRCCVRNHVDTVVVVARWR
jgi:hypothetical protein